MAMTIILTLIICVAAGIGVLIGACKGYIRTSTWGGTVLFTLLIMRAVAQKIISSDMSVYFKGVVVLGVAVGVMLVLTLIFALVKRYLNKAMAKRRELSYYKKYDEREENTERILNALDDGDKKAYRKNTKHKFKESAGAWGVTNRVMGGISTGINVAVVFGIIFSFIIVMADFARIKGITETFQCVFDNKVWQNTGAKWAFDLMIIALMCLTIRIGYRNGLISSLSGIVVLALLVCAGYLSYHLAFNISAFKTVAVDLAARASFLSSIAKTAQSMGLSSITETVLAQYIIMLGTFIVLLIPVILVGIFLPKLIDRLRVEKTVSVVDGIFGAVVLFAIVFVLLMVIMAVLYTLYDLEFMSAFNIYAYDKEGYNYFLGSMYQYNIFNANVVIKNLPLHKLLAPKA